MGFWDLKRFSLATSRVSSCFFNSSFCCFLSVLFAFWVMFFFFLGWAYLAAFLRNFCQVLLSKF